MQVPQVMPLMQFPQAIQAFLLVGGISDKSLFEMNNKIKVISSWMLMRMDPLLKLMCKTRLSFCKWQWEDDNKAGKSSKSITLTSHIIWQVLPLSSVHLPMIWIIEHCCVEVKARSQNIRLELCCHYSGWGIVLGLMQLKWANVVTL